MTQTHGWESQSFALLENARKKCDVVQDDDKQNLIQDRAEQSTDQKISACIKSECVLLLPKQRGTLVPTGGWRVV